MPGKAKVVDFRRFPSPDPKRLGKQDVLFVVQLEDGASLAIHLPSEKSSDADLKKAIEGELLERTKQVNRTIEL